MEIKLVQMPSSYFATFREHLVAAQEKALAESFSANLETSKAFVESELERALPNGVSTPGNSLYLVWNKEGETVGHLWLTVREFFGKQKLFISDIFISESHQGKGLGTKVMMLIEEEAARRSLNEIALHVFGSNIRARKLYESLGFVPTSVQMSKFLEQS